MGEAKDEEITGPVLQQSHARVDKPDGSRMEN